MCQSHKSRNEFHNLGKIGEGVSDAEKSSNGSFIFLDFCLLTKFEFEN